MEPWYGNILSDNFQIQRNPGIKKNGQSLAKSCFLKTKVQKTKIKG
uniref:Ribosomal protein L32 n=1 Tax=Anemone taipaiensis TaxID=2291099 RepID=A0A7H1JJR5_9MAGN|nr:ribosomal protein L32 [Anemone taipaiensis]QNT11516.1 ribosomal protein L32 [Anemone taipaiensis]